VRVGEVVEVEDEWEAHPQHGRHLRVTTCTPHAPVTPEGLKKYLGSGVIKGLGPKTAERIVDRFGEQTLAVIELEPERLTEAPGVGATMRDRIIAGWAEQREIRDLMLFLQSHEVSPGLAVKIYRQYGKARSSLSARTPTRSNATSMESAFAPPTCSPSAGSAARRSAPPDDWHRMRSRGCQRGWALLPAARGVADARGGAAETPVEALDPALEALRREKRSSSRRSASTSHPSTPRTEPRGGCG
jgi:ATP-dependent exoDNAse (exonuclease V) alpha subunit